MPKEAAFDEDLIDALPGGIYRLRIRRPGLVTAENWRSAVDTSCFFEFVSARFAEILGTSLEDLRGNPGIVADRIVPEDRPGFVADSVSAMAVHRHFHWTGRMSIRGQTRWIRFTSRSRSLVNGDIVRTGFVDDVTEGKHTQEAFAESEERFRTFFDLSSVGKAMTAPDGRMVRVNKALCDMLGYSADELQSRTFASITHPDDLPASIEGIRSLLVGERDVVDMEKRYVARDGHVVWARVRVGLLRDSAGVPVRLIVDVLDITDRKAAEESLRVANDRLRRSEYLLNETGRIAKVGGWDLDLETNRLAWTEGTRLIHEVPPEFDPTVDQAIGFYQPEDRPKIASAIRRAIEVAEPFDEQLRLITARGRERWVQAIGKADLQEGKAIRIAGTFQDITESRRTQEALRAREAIYSTVVEQAIDAITLIEPETGAFVEFNTVAYESLGYTREDFAALRVQDIDVGLSPTEIQQAFSRMSSVGGAVLETRVRHRDGTIRDVRISGRMVAVNGKKYLASILTDISDRKAIDAEIRQLNASLESRVEKRTVELADANRELEAFSYSVSHDLRAPLRAIEGFSAMVIRDHSADLDAEGRRLLGVVRTNALRMSRLIDDLLAFSRIGRGEIRYGHVNMSALARSAFEEVVGDLGMRARIDFRLGELPDVDGDGSLLHQVWLNLISNAVKFSAREEKPVIEVEGGVEGALVVYHVRDQGIGFDMAYANKLFGVFQRLHGVSEFEGTGVGLALVQRIVTRHGGKVWAKGAVGQGATFSFSLPVKDRF